MILKGLPESYKPLAIHITQSAGDISFSTFKGQLRSYGETEKFSSKGKADQVMKAASPAPRTCYGCRQTSHFIRDSPKKSETTKWCNYHKSSTHSDGECKRQQQKRDTTKKVSVMNDTENNEEKHTFTFNMKDHGNNVLNNPKDMLVDTGAKSHFVTTDTITRIDGTFKPSKHCMELADGTKTRNIAVKQGDAMVTFRDVNGRHVKAVLKGALYIPSYPQYIFSVKPATANGAEVKFQTGQNELIYEDGTTFIIEEHNKLYYLNTVEPHYDNNYDKVSVSHDIYTWHEIR
ncbi:uncharacterized protein LOC116614662 [Nematostella vectensis]|uniref:uncharacterized protein LOC116614662 n=1 Tax=Nematostella vectensis TaxID=45351 RepID=UPI0013905B59|nr:uncharacterized protein LOC116614662 [Nematostella vectensis]